MAERAHGRDFQQQPCVGCRLSHLKHSRLLLRRNFADIFKTPGKLRGKTPRTARKNAARAVGLAGSPSQEAQTDSNHSLSQISLHPTRNQPLVQRLKTNSTRRLLNSRLLRMVNKSVLALEPPEEAPCAWARRTRILDTMD